jgi:hypothetical protein
LPFLGLSLFGRVRIILPIRRLLRENRARDAERKPECQTRLSDKVLHFFVNLLNSRVE